MPGSMRAAGRAGWSVRWVLAAFACSACDTPSSQVDAGDLHGVFDQAPSASAAALSRSAKASGSASAGVPLGPQRERDPEAGCVREAGAAVADVRRTVGRPACRGSEILEWRDAAGAPRYACVYTPPGVDKRSPLPVVLFFHGSEPGLDDPSSLSKLTSLRAKMADADLTRDPAHRGFVTLAVQGRALLGGNNGASFDTNHVSRDNVDVQAVDHFLDVLIERELVDKTRVYAVGTGRGGEMAVAYAMIRADRVAAFASYASAPPAAAWSCPGPPPPGVVVYRACDAIVACDSVEEWLGLRQQSRAETKALRLGDDGSTETNCTPKNACTPKKALANHLRWPKSREKDMLEFLSGFRLK